MPRTIPLPIFQHQANASISQASPVSTQLYTVLATTKNVRIISITAWVTFTVQPTMDVLVTIDGVVYTFYVTVPATGTGYTAGLQRIETTLVDTDYPTRPFLLEGRSVKIEARRTGGTVSALDVVVRWAKIP